MPENLCFQGTYSCPEDYLYRLTLLICSYSSNKSTQLGKKRFDFVQLNVFFSLFSFPVFIFYFKQVNARHIHILE